MKRALPQIFLISALVLFGFGCKKDRPITQPSIQINSSSTAIPSPKKPSTPTPIPPVATGPSAEVIYLRQVIKNLLQIRSFRASMIIPSSDGTVSGEIEFVRQVGLRGSLSLPGAISSEVYLMGQTIYFRSGTSSWINLSTKPEGQKAAELFQSAFSLNAEESSLPISDRAQILATSDDPLGCKLYTLTQPKSVGSGNQQSQICVKNDLPVYLKAPGDQGVVQVTYRDFNADIPLHPPEVK